MKGKNKKKRKYFDLAKPQFVKKKKNRVKSLKLVEYLIMNEGDGAL